MVLIYCWLVVLSAFQTIKKSQRKTTATTTFRRATLPGSMSMFSVSSLKDGIQRAIGCTPPPPYEVGRAGHSLIISRFALRSFYIHGSLSLKRSFCQFSGSHITQLL